MKQDQVGEWAKADEAQFQGQILNAHLAAYQPGRDGLVFSGGDGQPIARAWLHRAWRKAVAEAELPADTTWHLLRHTYASILIDGGESVTVVARRLGHANPSETLRTYSHLWPDSDERTRQVVDAAFAVGSISTGAVPADPRSQ
jgi:integrase